MREHFLVVLERGQETPDRQIILLPHEEKTFLVAWPLNLDANRVEQTKKLVASWDS